MFSGIKTTGMRKRAWQVGVLLALLAAFALPAQALAGEHIPLKGSGAGTWGPGTHACGALVPLSVNGSGVASHLGTFTYTSQECVDFGAYPFALAGAFTISAANGDTLTGTFTGSAVIADDGVTILYHQQVTVTGGTGRFADATGQLVVNGSAYADGTYVERIQGAVSSAGASKR